MDPQFLKAKPIKLEPIVTHIQPGQFKPVTVDAAAVRLVQPLPTPVPVLRTQVTANIAAVRFTDPVVANRIAKVPFPVSGVPRNQISIPICPVADVTDQVLFEEPADATKKFYLPRYRLGQLNPQQYRAVLEQVGQSWSLILHLDKYAAPEIELASRDAREIPSSVVVILKFQIAGSGGVQKELVFQEVTSAERGIRAALSVNTLAERDELVRAISIPESGASLIVRRAINVAIPVPAPPDPGRIRPIGTVVIKPGIGRIPRPQPPGAPGPPLFRATSRLLDDVQRPFVFDREIHRYIFQSVTGVASQGPGLVRRQVQWKGAWKSYFQEQARPYMFYFLPDAFKIARRPQSPHAPIMAVQFESSDGSQERMQVTLDYVAAPFVEPGRIEAAAIELRQFLPPQLPPKVTGPVFEPLSAETNKIRFSIGLPRTDISKGPFQLREGALVNLKVGLVDSLLKLPLQDFQAIFDAMADATGAAVLLNGEVELDLGDGAGKISEKIPFRARMNDLVGELFEYKETPDAASGGVQATLKNAIESPLVVKRLTAKLRRDNTEVNADVRGVTPPVELARGQEVTFTVVPSTPIAGSGPLDAVFDLDNVEVRPDLEAIWNVIVAGQKPEYSRPITVKTLATTFAPPERAQDQIVEMDVQFKSGDTFALTASKLEVNASVAYPLSDVILRKERKANENIVKYQYRVTVVRNSGTQDSDWKESDKGILWIDSNIVPPAR